MAIICKILMPNQKLKYWKLGFNLFNVFCFKKKLGRYYSTHNSNYQLIEYASKAQRRRRKNALKKFEAPSLL